MPAETAATTKLLQLRVGDDLLIRIDRWRLAQGLPVLTRAAAIRRMVERVLDSDTAGTPRRG